MRQTFAGLSQQIIFSTHDLNVAADADRVIVVHEGRIAADGAPEEALAAYEAVLV